MKKCPTCKEPVPSKVTQYARYPLHIECHCGKCPAFLQWHERNAGARRDVRSTGGPPLPCPDDCPKYEAGSLVPLS